MSSNPQAYDRVKLAILRDEWAKTGRGMVKESARGAPLSLFDKDSAKGLADAIDKGVAAPYAHSQVSTLGGPKNVAIMTNVSLDPKAEWGNGIYQNSRYAQFHLSNNGVLEMFSGHYTMKSGRRSSAKRYPEVSHE